MCARSLFRLAILVPLFLAGGCFFRERATAPPGWEAADADSAEGSAPCPSITGRYAVGGDLDSTTPKELCHTSGAKHEWALDWLCDTNLATNLISGDSAASWIEIQQPDPDTIRLIFADTSTTPVELHRSKGDFGCSTTGITRVQRDVWRMATNYGVSGGEEPVAGKTVARTMAAMSTLFAYGGIQTLARTFRIDTEGALAMKIVRSRHGLMLGIPISEVYSTFVTWNIRVLSSHMGMTVSPFVMLVVADRLVADRSDWHPFNPDDYFPIYMSPAARVFYPQRRTLPEGRGLASFVRMKQ